jgi:hypothetical protein
MDYTFVETTSFTRRIAKLGLEGDLRRLQEDLSENPLKGVLDPGTGGLRKVRMADGRRDQGRSFGARVHYVYVSSRRVFYLVFVYAKDEQSTLSAAQKKQLRAVVQQLVSGETATAEAPRKIFYYRRW